MDSLKSPSDDEEADYKTDDDGKWKYNTQLAYPVLIKFIHESLAKFWSSVISGPLAKSTIE